MKKVTECVVCYDTKFQDSVDCQTCNANCCQMCSEQWFKISVENKTIPKCPNCSSFYLYNSVKDYKETELYTQYLESCYDYFMKDYKNEILDELMYKQSLEKLREQRIKFIEETFPKAIKAVIDIALSSKLKKINKDNKITIKNRITNGIDKRCMLLTCDGKLESRELNYRCIKCETEFCRKCERVNNQNHVCKQEDVETLMMISNNFVKCPNCKIPIERAEGCPSMTCANCKTQFEYTTGQVGGHGGESIDLYDKVYSLSQELNDNYRKDVIKIIQKIETEEPKVMEIDSVLRLLMKLTEDKTEIDLVKLAKLTQTYFQQKVEFKRYITKLNSIEKLHNDGKLNKHTLAEFITDE